MKHANILIVEAEPIIAMDIKTILETHGFKVAGQTDCGEDAILKAKDLQPDLIFMDVNLYVKVRYADQALYHAKMAGRNRVEDFQNT